MTQQADWSRVYSCRFAGVVAVNFWLQADAVERYEQRVPGIGALLRCLHKERVKDRDAIGDADDDGVLLLGALTHATQEQVCLLSLQSPVARRLW